jgi:hypothetical protein
MASSVATKGSFVHCLVGSLRALIYMLCMSALNSAKLCRLLYTVGDNRGLRLIHILMFISMNTQNILLSRILLHPLWPRAKRTSRPLVNLCQLWGIDYPPAIPLLRALWIATTMHSGRFYPVPGLRDNSQKFLAEEFRPVKLDPLRALLSQCDHRRRYLICATLAHNFPARIWVATRTALSLMLEMA